MAASDGGKSRRPSCVEIVDSVIKSKKNSNGIIDLQRLLLSEDGNEVRCAIESTSSLFCHFLENRNFSLNTTAGTFIPDESDVKYCDWLKDQYDEIKSILYDHLQHSNKNIQQTSLAGLMKLLKAEGENPIDQEVTWSFPKKMLQKIVECLSSDEKDMRHLIISFGGYTKYSDIKLYLLKALQAVLESTRTKPSPTFVHNIFCLLSEVYFSHDLCSEDAADVIAETFIHSNNGQRPVFKLKSETFSKNFSLVWIKFLSFELPSTLYKRILISLHKEVLPHIKNPLLLTDFLTDSYNMGGAISLLALNGLFFLIQKYNLEYPNFYQKLYALFQPDIITSKYRARFFFLSDLFLTSTHLPSYLVAAFIKRLARLALTVPAHILLTIIPFIGNLLIRHPGLKVLIHCPDKMDITEDPYDCETSDPAKCNAINSSLWEIKTLQDHWHPEVSKKAKFLNNNLPAMEWSISDALEMNFDDLLEEESKITYEDAPMSFDKPLGLFERHDDRMCDLWTL